MTAEKSVSMHAATGSVYFQHRARVRTVTAGMDARSPEKRNKLNRATVSARYTVARILILLRFSGERASTPAVKHTLNHVMIITLPCMRARAVG